MEIFLMFLAYFLLLIAVLLSLHRMKRFEERLNNVEFISGVIRAAYNADKPEKNVDSFVGDVEDSTCL